MSKLTLTIKSKKVCDDELGVNYIIKKDNKKLWAFDVPYFYDEDEEEISVADYCQNEEDRGRLDVVYNIFDASDYEDEKQIVKDIKATGKSTIVHELA